MKKLNIIGILSLAVLCISSCTDEWSQEQYRKMLSFKAPLGSNGVCDIYMRYKEDGSASYKVPVIISGSTKNDRDVDVVIDVDNDTLSMLNTERYLNREDLWYKQLPEEFYSFPDGNVCHIPSGTDVQTFNIDFDFRGFDLNDKWVLPLTIEEQGSTYAPNYRKGYYKALLSINLFNDYSGVYSAMTMPVYVGESTNNAMTVNTRTLKVVDENSVFFYAGRIWEEDVNRDKYKIILTFDEGSLNDAGNIRNGSVTLKSADPANKAKISGTGSYKITRVKHGSRPNIDIRTVVISLDYNYTDFTTDPFNPTAYHAMGSMAAERLIDLNIPDEDQAIQW